MLDASGPVRRSLAGLRVAVVSTEQPGSRMAGPGIRATALAAGLGAHGAEVVLACPDKADRDLGVPVVPTSHTPAAFRRLAADRDVVVTQPVRVDIARGLHSGRARVVYDLYVPSYIEYLAAQVGEPADPTVAAWLRRRNQREYATALASGDAFACASDRQRDHWLGALGQAGRLRSGDDGAHGKVRPDVAVVPFGVPEEPPQPAPAPVLRGSLVPRDAFVLLWTGGLWNWFDPETVLTALRDAVAKDPRIHLVFMAGSHADPRWRPHGRQRHALDLAASLGLTRSGHVAVADSWVPFGKRGHYLLEADLGVCAFFASDETRLSFRTRFLDHLWAGLPTLTTAGGSLADAMAGAGAARTVPAGDVLAWTRALVELAADPPALQTMSRAALDLADSFSWTRSVEALAELIAATASQPPQVSTARRPSLWDASQYLALLAAVRGRERLLARREA